jgi:hypothetical protein
MRPRKIQRNHFTLNFTKIPARNMENRERTTAIDEWMEMWSQCQGKEKYQMMELKKSMKGKTIWERTRIQNTYMHMVLKNFRCVATLPKAGLWVHQKDPWETCLRVSYKDMAEGRQPKNPEQEPIMPLTEDEWTRFFDGWRQE